MLMKRGDENKGKKVVLFHPHLAAGVLIFLG
jgi:hypothetical protein